MSFFNPLTFLRALENYLLSLKLLLRTINPPFFEFYAEWCEVCKAMAPKVSALKEEYGKDINFVFLNVDNQQWENYVRKFEVNGIPQVNLFDRKGNLKSTLIGKQDELTIKESIDNLEREVESHEEILNNDFSAIKKLKIMSSLLVATDDSYQFRDLETIGKLCLKIDLQFSAIDLCSS